MMSASQPAGSEGSNKVGIHAFVSGKVQGVEYRGHCREKIRELGLKGAAINIPNGMVEVKATGDPQRLKHLCSWLPVGSPVSHVTNISLTSHYCHKGSDQHADCHIGKLGVNGKHKVL
eukprot:TRINITY_DN28649_c0_g1_i1.p1 TRINITY_DN28649_c0_g1~~TRINITY_DN28649_c0_g1_i1.p1  ORF type:complete len:118 (+),score=18.31 TRINITY_DN28649_c0_g1_i1:74-427(+)